MARRLATALPLVAASIAIGAGASTAATRPGPVVRAQPSASAFLTCLHAHGAPLPVGSQHPAWPRPLPLPAAPSPSADGPALVPRPATGMRPGVFAPVLSPTARDAFQKALSACKELLPRGPGGPVEGPLGDPRHRFALPTPARVAAFRACLAAKGFATAPPVPRPQPDVRDPARAAAFKAALKSCLSALSRAG